MNLGPLIDRFKHLQTKWDHVPRGRAVQLQRIERMMAQFEMFYLAQAICSNVDHNLQSQLDQTRRQIMQEIKEGPTDSGGQVTTARVYQAHHWSDFQLSPEFCLDPQVAGRFVARKMISDLNKLHKQQIKRVLDKVRDAK